MGKEMMIGLVFVLLFCITADAVLSGCVTYEQARAQGIQGSDAELYSKGFCPGTSTTAAPTTAKEVQTGQSAATSEQSAGPSRSPQATSASTKQQLWEREIASNEEFYNAQSVFYDSPVDGFDYDAADELYNRYRDAKAQSLAAYDAAYRSMLQRRDTCYDGCETKAGINRVDSEGDYDLWRSCRDACQRTADLADAEAYRVHVDAVIQYNKRHLEELTALAGSPRQQEGLPKGPRFDTDSDKGLDIAGKIAASMGGYLGNAYVLRPDGTKVIPGKELYLNVDDKVVTGTESKANIIFGNIGKMKLGPDSELRVGRAQLDQYYLMKGTLKTDIMLKEGEQFEIRTPNAKVKMKGTDFVTSYDESSNTTTVYLNEGALEVESQTQNISLSAGSYCTILADGTITTGQMEQEGWTSLDDNFYDESVALGARIVKIYLWLTLAVIVVSSVLSRYFVKKASKHARKESKDLGLRSIVLGLLGLVAFLFPMIGYPLSVAAVACARIQKIRRPSLVAKIGLAIGISGVLLNGVIFLFAFIGVSLA